MSGALVARLRPFEARYAAGIAAVAAIASVLYTRFGINGSLSRDEGIYTYAAQRFAHGVAPYKSIFDPKTPLASLLGGVAAALARAVGVNDVKSIRLVFFLCAVLTVVAVYVLTVRLWGSIVGGIAAGVVFTSFIGFAQDALSGPDAKTPGVLCVVVAMWLLVRRNWAWAAFFGALAFLTWQPFVIYPLVALALAPWMAETGQRLRALLRAAIAAGAPLVAMFVYFAAAGALKPFVESTIEYPATGVVERSVSFGKRFTRIWFVVEHSYKGSGWLLWAGLMCLLVLTALLVRRHAGDRRAFLREPLVYPVLATFAFEACYAVFDFQGYPDVYALLPYGALGIGGAVVALLNAARNRSQVYRGGVAVVGAGAVVLVGLSWAWFDHEKAIDPHPDLRAQLADACAVQRILGPDGRLWVLGEPAYLVLTHRANPDRYIYLEAGVDQWKINHTKGGFSGWVGQIENYQPSVIAMGGWYTGLHDQMGMTLRAAGFRGRYVGNWLLLLSPEAMATARQKAVKLTVRPTDYATGSLGRQLPAYPC